jgi:hypothetical protein
MRPQPLLPGPSCTCQSCWSSADVSWRARSCLQALHCGGRDAATIALRHPSRKSLMRTAFAMRRTIRVQLWPNLPLTHPRALQLEMDAASAAARAASDPMPLPPSAPPGISVPHPDPPDLVYLHSDVAVMSTSHWMKLVVLCGALRMAQRMAVTVSKANCSNTLA